MEEDGEIKASIRDIEKPMVMKKGKSKVRASAVETDTFVPRKNRKKNQRIFLRVAILVIVVLVIVISLLTTVFSNAKLEVQLRDVIISIDDEFVAEKEDSNSQNVVPYTFISSIATGESSINVQAKGEEEVETSSTGTLTIFNESDTIRLRVGTRFQTESGLVYKSDQAITVPGQRIVDGNILPGNVDINVYADSTGSEFNMNNTDLIFRLPGLQEGGFIDEYQKVYAKSKTAITGGFAGRRLIADEVEINNAREELRQRLIDGLEDKINDRIGDESLIFDELIEYNFTSLPTKDDKQKNEIILTESVYASVLVFNESVFAQFIFKNNDGTNGTNAPKSIRNKEKVTFIRLDKENFSFAESESFGFSLTGEIGLAWDVDEEEVKAKIAGTKSRDILTTLSDFIGIEGATVSVFPKWNSKIPISKKKISVEFKY